MRQEPSVPGLGRGGATVDDRLGGRWERRRHRWRGGGRRKDRLGRGRGRGGRRGRRMGGLAGGAWVDRALVALPASGAIGGAEPRADPGPGLVPAVGSDDGPQGQHRVDASGRPVQAAALQAILDDHLDDDRVGALADPAADRIAGRAGRSDTGAGAAVPSASPAPGRAARRAAGRGARAALIGTRFRPAIPRLAIPRLPSQPPPCSPSFAESCRALALAGSSLACPVALGFEPGDRRPGHRQARLVDQRREALGRLGPGPRRQLVGDDPAGRDLVLDQCGGVLPR
jgi:hypothetical protein